MRTLLITASISLALLTACGSQPVTTHTYTLHPVSLETDYQSAPSIALGDIELAPYLKHEGIVVETSPGQISIAKHNLWAEPLSYSVRRYLQVALSQAIGAPVALDEAGASGVKQTVSVSIHQLHGTESGTVRLVASWQIQSEDSKDIVVTNEFSATEKTAADGYAELVRGQKKLLNELAAEIGERIN
jgi:uncharacterized lipoprotein YmbA